MEREFATRKFQMNLKKYSISDYESRGQFKEMFNHNRYSFSTQFRKVQQFENVFKTVLFSNGKMKATFCFVTKEINTQPGNGFIAR